MYNALTPVLNASKMICFTSTLFLFKVDFKKNPRKMLDILDPYTMHLFDTDLSCLLPNMKICCNSGFNKIRKLKISFIVIHILQADSCYVDP